MFFKNFLGLATIIGTLFTKNKAKKTLAIAPVFAPENAALAHQGTWGRFTFNAWQIEQARKKNRRAKAIVRARS